MKFKMQLHNSKDAVISNPSLHVFNLFFNDLEDNLCLNEQFQLLWWSNISYPYGGDEKTKRNNHICSCLLSLRVADAQFCICTLCRLTMKLMLKDIHMYYASCTTITYKLNLMTKLFHSPSWLNQTNFFSFHF